MQNKLLQLAKEIIDVRKNLVRIEQKLVLLSQESQNVLDIPWLSQLGPGADYGRGDCGPACLAMWLRYLLSDNTITVDDVSKRINLPQGYRYTTPAHIIRAAHSYNVNLYWRKNGSRNVHTLHNEIDKGQPCIILIHYDSLPSHLKFDPGYQAGHWLLVTGYSDSSIWYHDPYWTEDGIKQISKQDLYKAWNDNYKDGNSNLQVIRIKQ